MAEPQYFPPLERCLKGDHLLLAWQDVYSSLCQPQNKSSLGLQKFFADSATQNILKKPFSPFEPHQNSQFATITAAINITPDDNGPYDIKQIKEDALWLAEVVQIDKVAALRIVVLEWQKRPAVRMLSRSLNGEEGAELDGDMGISIFAPNPPNGDGPKDTEGPDGTSFDSTYQRQLRLIELSISEAFYVLATTELKARQFASAEEASNGQKGAGSLDEIGRSLFEALCPDGDASKTITDGADALGKSIDLLGINMDDPVVKTKHKTLRKFWVELHEFWIKAYTTQAISILQCIFTIADFSSKLPSAEAVLSYFELMGQYEFLGHCPESPLPSLPRLGKKLQNALQLTSLAILKLDKALEPMDKTMVGLAEPLYSDISAPAPRLDYLQTTSCIRRLHSIFENMTEKDAQPAASAMFAWTCIYIALYEASALSRRGSADSTDTEPAQPPPQNKQRAIFRQAVDAIQTESQSAEQGEAFLVLATCAVNRFHLFDQIADLASTINQDFGTGVNGTYEIRCRRMLLSLISAGAPLVQYGQETLGALLSVIAGDRLYWELVDRELNQFDPVTQLFIEDSGMLIDRFLGESIGRYPEESTPYYRIMRALFLNGKLNLRNFFQMLQYLNETKQFTRRLPQGFTAYDEANDIEPGMDDSLLPQRLLADLPYFVSRRSGLSNQRLAIENGGSQSSGSYGENCVPAHTVGMPADESKKPIVVTWNVHHFSPFKYMIGCLLTVLAGNDWVDASTGMEVPLEEVADIISLLGTIILATHKVGASEDKNEARASVAAILDTTFVEADPRKTLLAIVAEIFETQLQYQQSKPGDEVSLDVLVRCLHFFHAVAVSLPNRIWPVLSRSKLLEIDGNGGSLAAIVTAVEMITGRYDFLIGSIRLFEALVDASLQSGAIDNQPTSKALTRLNSRAVNQAGGEALPQRMATTVMTSFSRTLVSVFRNSRSWRYVSILDQSEISTRLSETFDRIMHYTYGYDDEPDVHKKAITSILAESGIYLAEILLSTSLSHQLSEPLTDMLTSGLAGISSGRFQEFEQWPVHQVQAALSLCKTALRIGVARDAPTSCLELQLFRAAPILARLYAAHDSFKSLVATLLENLVTSAARSKKEPPSLLGYMGPGTAQDFLSTLSDLSRPVGNIETEIEIWNMLSAVVSSRQQWFAISLLTGSSPKQKPKKVSEGKVNKSHGKPVLAYALNELSNISAIEPVRALAILKFVALCQNHWAWAVGELRKHPNFISGITGYVRSLKREDEDDAMQICTETAIAASIAEVLTMYLHAASQVGDTEAVKIIAPHLQYFRKYGIAAPKYNSSLHSKLKSNLEKNYGGLLPAHFKHTEVFSTEFGPNYFYDVSFETKVLNFRQGTNKKALEDVEKEFRRANIDLSLVEAQIKLLTQWKLLATQLSKIVDGASELTGLLITVVKQCLAENVATNVPEAIFERLRFHRIDLAMILLQRLVALNIRDRECEEEMRSLLPAAWRTIRKTVDDFDVVFAASNAEYYRSLLQIMFLTLQPLRKSLLPSQQSQAGRRPDANIRAPKESQQLLEVVLNVIIKGFRSLSSILHENPTVCQPNDFVLLTAMLQTILEIPSIELIHSQIALFFANNNISGYATSLFSWADQLVIDGDPVFGELAILFLLEMSSVPLIAETMAVDGVLSQLTSAKLMQLYARPRGMGPFDTPTRLHSIWTRGILPLCLNLLDAVGAPLAAEVVSFLNHFPNQLNRLSTELSNRSSMVGTKPTDAHITLSMASETHSLALLWLVIERYRAAGASTGTLMQDIPGLQWDKAGVKEDVDDWVQGRASLGGMVLPANEREAEMARVSGVGGRSRLEERVWGELVAAAECLGAEGS